MRKLIKLVCLFVSITAALPALARDPGHAFGNPLAAMVAVTFPDRSTTFNPSPSQVATLGDFADASMVTISGRTSTYKPSAIDELLALKRAASARAWLIARGVSPLKIFINYVSAADYAVDNSTPEGRLQNQRVDIEVFYVQPFQSGFVDRNLDSRTARSANNKQVTF